MAKYTQKVKIHKGRSTFFREKAEFPTGRKFKVEGKTIKVMRSKGYTHYVIDPHAKGETRILDIGEPMKHQLVRVKTKTGWVTRSVRVQRGVRVEPRETKEIIRKAVLYQQ